MGQRGAKWRLGMLWTEPSPWSLNILIIILHLFIFIIIILHLISSSLVTDRP